MFAKLLASLGAASATTQPAAPRPAPAMAPPYSPYRDEATNATYNLLFCDDFASFAARPSQMPSPWQAALAASRPDIAALEAIARDPEHDGRVRYLAYKRLREAGKDPGTRQLLGVIVEMALDGGLDTLAAYADGGVRYINQTGKIVIAEGATPLQPMVTRLFDVSRAVVERIGPWQQPRRAPPAVGNIRLSFLVSDGLYFGEGGYAVMHKEPLAAPVIDAATQLLVAVVEMGRK